jgi:hypothetical protein
MNRSLLRVTGGALVMVAAVGVSAALYAQEAKPVPMVPAPATADPQVVDTSIQLTPDVSVGVSLWLSPVLSDQGSRSVRVVSLTADYNVKQLSISKSYFFGPIDAAGSEPLEASANSVSIGIAKMLAAQILGQSPAGEFVPERVGPFQGTVRPVKGKTWAEVASEADLELTFRAK